jgi:hypothetical protein
MLLKVQIPILAARHLLRNDNVQLVRGCLFAVTGIATVSPLRQPPHSGHRSGRRSRRDSCSYVMLKGLDRFLQSKQNLRQIRTKNG